MLPETTILKALRALVSMEAPTAFVALVWMASTMSVLHPGVEYDVLEFYAGRARIARTARRLHYRAMAFDVNYDSPGETSRRNAMDINGAAGFVLAIVSILSGRADSLFASLAVKCSSWTAVNRGTSRREEWFPEGNMLQKSVRDANKMVSRSVLLIALIQCLNGVWVLENPGSTLIHLHPAFQWLVEKMQALEIDTFKQKFYMKKYLHKCPKPTLVWSNSPVVRFLDKGPVTRAENDGPKTVRQYVSKKTGKTGYGGTDELKKTEEYPAKYAAYLVELIPSFLEVRGTLPEVDEVLEEFRLPTKVVHWAWAELETDVKYLKSSKYVRLSEGMKQSIPAA